MPYRLEYPLMEGMRICYSRASSAGVWRSFDQLIGNLVRPSNSSANRTDAGPTEVRPSVQMRTSRETEGSGIPHLQLVYGN